MRVELSRLYLQRHIAQIARRSESIQRAEQFETVLLGLELRRRPAQHGRVLRRAMDQVRIGPC